MKEIFNINNSACPIACKYCVITKVTKRRNLWNKKTLIGLNKAVTILNPPPDLNNKKQLNDFYNFPLKLLKADIVGFNAISDPFWPKYEKELLYFLKKVAPIAKIITCVTKFPIKIHILKKLAKIKNFRLIVSITGLDKLENTNTQSRLKTLKLVKQYGIKAFPLIHPYIPKMSNLSFLKELKKLGYRYVDVKGLRYNHKNMSSWMPKKIQTYYLDTYENETLPDDGYKQKILKAGLKIMSLKKWYKINIPKTPKLNKEEAIKNTKEILKYANITSSDEDKEVIKASILRKM